MTDWLPRTAVITGAASGIGLALAHRLARRGLRVMLADLPGEALDRAAHDVPDALAQPCDIADPAQVDGLADAAFAALGTVELLLTSIKQKDYLNSTL